MNSYFDAAVLIQSDGIRSSSDTALDRWEQTFIYNHLAQGVSAAPTGVWMSFEELPNTISKSKSMKAHVEAPVAERFSGEKDALTSAATAFGAADVRSEFPETDAALTFSAFPRVPVLLLFLGRRPGRGNRSQGEDALR